MRHTTSIRHKHTWRLKQGLLCGASFFLLSTFAYFQPVMAQDVTVEEEEENIDPFNPRNRSRFLGYSFSISPKISYSDNVTLAPEGEERSDGLVSVEGRGGILLDRVNFTGIVNGRVEVGSYFSPPSVNGEQLYDKSIIDHDIRAAGTAQLVENMFYLDASAVSERRALNERSRFSTASLAANDRQADAFSFSISPYLRTEFSNEGTLEARYRYVTVKVDDKNVVPGIDDFLNDSESHEVLAEYSSGKLLDRLGFSIRAYGNKTRETGSNILPRVDYEQASVSGSLSYALNRKLSVVGTVGFDDIHTENNALFDDGDLSGVFWKAGVSAKPGRRTEVRLEAGERYGGFLLEGSAEYLHSSRLRFVADISRNLNTSSQLRATSQGILQSETLSFADDLRSLQNLTANEVLESTLQFNDDLRDLTERRSGLATSNNAGISMIINSKRAATVLRAAYDNADFGFQKTNTISLSGAWNRQISRKLNVYAQGSYLDTSDNISGSLTDCVTALSTDPFTVGLSDDAVLQICQAQLDSDVETQTVSLLGGVSYEIFKEISTFIQYSLTQRSADVSSLEYEESAITAGMTFDF